MRTTFFTAVHPSRGVAWQIYRSRIMAENETSQPNQKNPSAAQYEVQGERIADHARISAVLRRIMANRSLLTVRIPGNGTTYNSAMLEVNPEQGFLILDELNSKSGHALVSKTSELIVTARAEGVETRFTGRVVDIGLDNGVTYYRVTFPKNIHYSQRRAHYRAPAGIAKESSVVLTRANNEMITGLLHDISVGGVGVRLRKSTPDLIEEGETVPRCVIHFPDGGEFICVAEVRSIRQGMKGNYRVLGLKFIDLSAPQRSKIQRFVAGLDREIRKHPRGG